MNALLINELAFAMAHELLTIVKNCLRPDEYRDAFDCFFEECKAGLEAYESQANILRNRPQPSAN
jgi:hypothetical protein